MSPSEAIARWLDQRESVRASRTKLGMVGYAHLSAMLRDTPMTARGLQVAAGLGHVASYRFLMSMHALKRVHICGWEEKARSPLLPLFTFGPGVDMEPPKVRSTGRPVQSVNAPTSQLCAGVIAFEQLLRAIEAPASRQEVVDATGLHYDTVMVTLDALQLLELAHVPLWIWTPHGGPCLPQYELGPGLNVPKPRVRLRERRELLRDRQAQRRMFQPLLHFMAAQAAGADQ